MFLALTTQTSPQPELVPITTLNDYQNQQPQSNLTSVLSSFSNILTLKRNPSEEFQNIPPPPLVGVDYQFEEGNSTPTSIPLFNPTIQQPSFKQPPPPQTSQGIVSVI